MAGGQYIQPLHRVFLNLSGGTVSGNTLFTQNLSATTFYSGATNLGDLISGAVTSVITGATRVQNGINTYTAGTQFFPSVNVSGLTIDNIHVSGESVFFSLYSTTLSGGTIFSGGTDVSDLFSRVYSVVSTKANLSGATFTGAIIAPSIKTTSISGTSISATTFYSGSTDLATLFQLAGTEDVTRVQSGLNTYTGGTANSPTVNVSALTIDTIIVSGASSFGILSATTIYSGGTDLSSLFQLAGTEDVTRVQNGLNTYTGGTANRPAVNVSALTINSITVSGASTFSSLYSTTISGGTIYSGGTDLSNTFSGIYTGLSTKFDKSGGTIIGDVLILGNVEITGTATTINTQIVQSKDNNITLNLSGTHLTAISGGITLLSGQTSGLPSVISSDSAGNWISNVEFYAPALSGTSITATNFFSGGSNLNTVFAPINHTHPISDIINLQGELDTKANLSGATFTGQVKTPSLSATTLSGGTIYSGSTELGSLFSSIVNASNDITRVQPGINTYTGGTDNFPTVNVSALTIDSVVVSGTARFTSISATTISGGTLYSGSTNLFSIFAPSGYPGDITRVQSGVNTYTGGTANSPTVNVSALTIDSIIASGTSRFSTFSATSFSATTIYSGSTDLSAILNSIVANVTLVQPGINTYTGGTYTAPTVNVSALTINTLNASGNSIVSANFSANTFFSGGTNISSLFALQGTQTKISQGTNIQTGGTVSNPIISTVASPQFFNLNASGTTSGSGATFVNITGQTISGGTFFSGSTPLTTIINLIVTGQSQSLGFSGWTASTGINSIVANNGTNTAFGNFAIVGGKSNVGSGNYSFIGGGLSNSGTSPHSAVISGKFNLASGTYSFVGAGLSNLSQANYSSIIGGSSNHITSVGTRAVIVGGVYNTISDSESFIGGGDTNTITTTQSFIGGGTLNNANGVSSFIAAGEGNTTSGVYSSVLGGKNNRASATSSAVVGGSGNTVSGAFSVIIGGTGNTVSGFRSGIGAGRNLVNSFNDTWMATNMTAVTISASTYFSGSTNLSSLFQLAGTEDVTRVQNGLNTYTGGTANSPSVNVSALTIDNITVSGISRFISLSATSLSGGTIYSGSTDLSLILASISAGASDITRVQPGTNVYTGGTGNFPTINVSALTINTIVASGSSRFASISGTSISATTLYSGSTDLSTLFQLAGTEDVTRVQNGLNTYTGGTANSPTVNVSALTINNIIVSGSSRFISLSATTLSGGTIYSGSTDLSAILNSISTTATLVQPGLNTYTGGTAFVPTVNVSALTINTLNASGNSIVSANFSANTIYSGSTDVSSLFALQGTQTKISQGTNIQTGGTVSNPIISTVASPVFNNLNTSGVTSGPSAVFTNITGQTISGGTLFSGSTPLTSVINRLITGQSQSLGFSGWTASTGINSIIANNGTNVGSGRYSVVIGKSNLGSGSYSFIGGVGNSGTSSYSSAIAGRLNLVSGAYSFAGAGANNIAGATYSSVVAGSSNQVTSAGTRSAIMAGVSSTVSGTESFIGGGDTNAITSTQAFIGGGTSNSVNGQSSFIGGGEGNTVTGIRSGIGAGQNLVNSFDDTWMSKNMTAVTVSATTYYSGSTDLTVIIQRFTTAAISGATITVQPGSNITTGGTMGSPIISVVANPSFNNLSLSGTGTVNSFSATTLSAGTIYSGSTDLFSIFAPNGYQGDITRIQLGTNTYTGGTANFPTINVSALTINAIVASGNSRFTSISATTVSGGTLYSGSTELGVIIQRFADGNDITRVQPGTNIYTGGTDNFPTINVSALTINAIVASGNSRFISLSASSLSASSLFIDSQQIHGTVVSATSPTDSGSTWIRNTDYATFIFDTGRGKWLSVSEQFISGSRNAAATTTQFLRHYDGVLYSDTPFRMPYDAILTKFIINGAATDTWRGTVTTGTTQGTNDILSLGLSLNTYSAKTDFNIPLYSGQTIFLAMSGSSVNRPRVDLYFKQRGS